jgi:3-hydroxy-3-methylglutaryl CoA synthase
VLKVFLSHTSELSDFVKAAEGAVQRSECRPIDMKYFAARDQAPAEYCAKQVEEADVYVGIIGFCYGTPVRNKPKVSYTEHEFDTATRLGKDPTDVSARHASSGSHAEGLRE